MTFLLALALAVPPAVPMTAEPSPAEPAGSSASAPTSPALHVDLGAGASIEVPPEFSFVRNVEPTPSSLTKAMIFQDVAAGSVLLLNVLRADGTRCFDRLKQETSRLQEARTAPKIKPMFQLATVQPRHVGQAESVYHEGVTRSPNEARAGKPYHGLLNYLACARGGAINLSVMKVAGEVDDRDRAAARWALGSWHPPAGP